MHVPLNYIGKVSCQFENHHIYKKVILMEYKIKNFLLC